MAESENPEQLLDTMRREIVAAELQILELNDCLLSKDTDRADAVALLGQAELVLEEKIGYIMSLDQSLNARIKELESECDRKTEEIDRRGVALQDAIAADAKNRAERDIIIEDLSNRLELANQEINRAHLLAGEFAAKANQTSASLEICRTELSEHKSHLAEQQDRLQKSESELENRTEIVRTQLQQIEALSQQLNETADLHARTSKILASEQTRLTQIRESALWKWSRPWRALFGPKA